MTGRDHQVHTQQGEERNDVELALLHEVFFTRHPTMCHEEGDERTDTQDGLDDNGHAVGDIHATEGGRRAGSRDERPNIDANRQQQNDKRERGVINSLALVVGAHEKIGHKENEHRQEQRQFGRHTEKLRKIHF